MIGRTEFSPDWEHEVKKLVCNWNSSKNQAHIRNTSQAVTRNQRYSSRPTGGSISCQLKNTALNDYPCLFVEKISLDRTPKTSEEDFHVLGSYKLKLHCTSTKARSPDAESYLSSARVLLCHSYSDT